MESADAQTARDDFHASVQLQMAELTNILLQTKQEARACREIQETRTETEAAKTEIGEARRREEDTQYEEVHAMLSEVLADQQNRATPDAASREREADVAERLSRELDQAHRSQKEALRSLALEHHRMGERHLQELRAALRGEGESSPRATSERGR